MSTKIKKISPKTNGLFFWIMFVKRYIIEVIGEKLFCMMSHSSFPIVDLALNSVDWKIVLLSNVSP